MLASYNTAGVTGKWRETRGVVKLRTSSFELLVPLGIPKCLRLSQSSRTVFIWLVYEVVDHHSLS